MQTALVIVASIVVIILLAVMWNQFDVQRRGNGPDYDPSVAVLRTPDSRFEELTDFPYEPHYLEINDPDLGALRVHYIDEGPADGHVIVLLHGQATWAYSFRKFIPVMTAAGFRVIAPDFVGFGRSDKPADWEQHTFDLTYTLHSGKNYRADEKNRKELLLMNYGNILP